MYVFLKHQFLAMFAEGQLHLFGSLMEDAYYFVLKEDKGQRTGRRIIQAQDGEC